MNIRASLVIRSLCILALVSAVVVGVLQQGAVAQARIEHQALLKDGEEVERLTHENTAIAPLRATNELVMGLRQKQRELARLRNEVVQLQAQAAEAAKLAAENQRLASFQNSGAPAETNAVPANFMPRAAMTDMGLGSPEAAVQTYLYAMFQGDVKRVLQCQSMQANLTPEQEEDQSGSLRREFAVFPGFIIAETNIISPDEEQVGIQASPGGVIFPIHLIRNGNEWNVK